MNPSPLRPSRAARATLAAAVAVASASLSACGAHSPFVDDLDASTSGQDVVIPPFDGGAIRTYRIDQGTAAFVNACDLPGSQSAFPMSDDNAQPVVLPFEFMLYAQRSSAAWFSTNGTFGFGSPSSVYSNTCLPTTNGNFAAPVVFAFWDDLYTRSRGVCYATRGTAPRREFVLTWDDMTFCCSPNDGNHFAVTLILTEGAQTIETRYRLTTSDARVQGASATVGIQAPGSPTPTSTQFSCDSAMLRDGMSLRFVPLQ